MKKISILFLVALLPMVASAQTLIDGIYYRFNKDQATVPWSYFGTIVANTPTGIKTLEGTQQDANRLPDGKYLKDGKLVIIKNGKTYQVSGAVKQ